MNTMLSGRLPPLTSPARAFPARQTNAIARDSRIMENSRMGSTSFVSSQWSVVRSKNRRKLVCCDGLLTTDYGLLTTVSLRRCGRTAGEGDAHLRRRHGFLGAAA